MASKITRNSIIQGVVKRGYGAQAATKSASSFLPSGEPEVTAFPSGTVVASIENNSPVSKIALLFKAGSRYETVSNAGVSHALRRAAGLSTANFSAFGLMRNAQQNGASISVDGGREHISYEVDVIRDYVDTGLSLIGDIASSPAFKPWEIDALSSHLHLDVSLKSNSTIALENIHSAAFRSGLGNSLFVPSHRIGGISSDEIKAYFDATHGTAGMAVVGLGVEHDVLVKFAKGLGLANVKASSLSTYKGGEVRTENGSNVAHVAVCGSGASLTGQDVAALAIAQYALGVGSTVYAGSNASSPLAAAVAKAGGAGAACAINVNYTDAGLFGYNIVADADAAGAIVKAVHAAVKNANLTDKDVSNAKYKLKTALLMSAESQEETLDDLGLQALTLGNYTKPSELIAKIDGVPASAVNSAIKRAFSGKLSMGASGGLKTVPYVDEL